MRRLRDVDPDRLHSLRIGAYASLLCIPLGLAAAVSLNRRGLPILFAIPLGIFGVAVFLYTVVSALVYFGSAPASLLYMGGGGGAPQPPNYLSRVHALANAGRIEEEQVVLNEALADDPMDHYALLELARLYANGPLQDEARSLNYLRSAIETGRLAPQTEALKRRQICEVQLSAGSTKAAPDLARLAEAFPESPHGAWASAELADLKQAMIARNAGAV